MTLSSLDTFGGHPFLVLRKLPGVIGRIFRLDLLVDRFGGASDGDVRSTNHQRPRKLHGSGLGESFLGQILDERDRVFRIFGSCRGLEVRRLTLIHHDTKQILRVSRKKLTRLATNKTVVRMFIFMLAFADGVYSGLEEDSNDQSSTDRG